MRIILLYFAIKYKGKWDLIYKALEKKEKIDIEEIQKLEEDVRKGKYKFITILDDEYPVQFTNAFKPPFVIFYEGDLRILNNDSILITGNNDFSHVKNNLDDFLEMNSKTIVSGFYRGVDKYVYDFSKQDTNFIFVSANGLDNPYSSVSNESLLDKRILSLSEYPTDTHVSKVSLKARNRLLSALANKLIVVASKHNSGVMNIVSHMISLGKEVYCFNPSRLEDDGNRILIDQGAKKLSLVN